MFQVRLLGQFDVRADGKRVLVPSRSGQSLFAYLVLNAGTEHRREKLAGMIWPDVSDDVARKNLRQELWRIRKAITTQSPSGGDALVADEFLIAFQTPHQFWLDVEQLERAPEEIDGLLNAIALYRGELLPGFYDEWVILERDRVQALFEARCGLALEKLTLTQQWKQVQEWAERWIVLGQTPEPAYRALMIAAAAQGDSAKLAITYERCVEALQNEVGVEPSGETRELFQQLSNGENAAPHLLKPTSPVLIQPSGTVTFLFTDIEGSTNLLERLGNDYANLLGDQRDLLRATAEKYNGHEVDTQGDAFFFAFFRAADAVNFAAEAQHALAAHPWQHGERLRVRMGLHTGEPMLARTGYVGMDVHRAARIGAAGHGGQVLLSQTTSLLVANELPNGTHLDDLGEHRLKDLRYPLHIIQLTIDDLPSDFPPLKVFETAVEPPAPGEPPFKGLEFFDEADANLFFGREQLVEKLTLTLQAQNFLAVVIGASGSGKSSVVRAGLIPALKSPGGATHDWRVFVMTPTAHPLEALATTLTRASESVTATATLLDDLAKDSRSLQLFMRRMAENNHSLLVVDQFEELFTLCHDDFEREQFVDCLLDAVKVAAGEGATRSQLLTLVLTIRADFYAHLAQYPELRDAVAKQQEYIGPMNTEELRRAMVEPATRGGWVFEPGLVDLILRDVGDEPGALPLLSHALLETWKRRSGHTMTLKGYADSGGVQGAISHTAETTYQQLTPEQQTIARNVFLRLTELGEGTEDTRRRAKFEELEIGDATRDEVRKVLTILADARLISTGEHTAEVAHEALIREWTRLREWLNEDREGLKLHRNLTEAAHEWELLERDGGMLYRGARLAQAKEFAETNASALNAQERAFLDASVENEKRETREKEEQQRRELEAAQTLVETQTRATKQLRRRAVVLAGVLVLALLAAGAALFFLTQSNANLLKADEQTVIAETHRDAAEKERRTAFARELAASATSSLDGDPERSVLLALEAVKATAQDQIVLPEAETALHQAVLAHRLERTIVGHERLVSIVRYSPDGTRLVTNSSDGTIRLWDPSNGKEHYKFPIAPGWLSELNFNEDGTWLGASDMDGDSSAAKIWDTRTGELVRSFDLGIPADQWWTQSFNLGFSRVVVTSRDGSATVFDVKTGKRLFSFSRGAAVDCVIAYSPDSSRIAVGCSDGKASVYDAVNGKELFPLCCHANAINRIVYSPDGTRIGTAGNDRTAKIWDALTGDQVLTLIGHTDAVNDVEFSTDGTRLATTGADQHPKVWDASTGKEQLTLRGHTGFGNGVAFSPDGRHLATTSADRTVKIWDITPIKESLVLSTGDLSSHLGLGTVVYSPDGKSIAVSLDDGTIELLDATTGNKISTFHGHSATVQRIVFSPDGSRLASASDDTTAKIWDVATRKELLTFKGHASEVLAIAFSPDGNSVASGSLGTNAKIRIWNATDGHELAVFEVPSIVFDVKFSPDGKYLAAGIAAHTSYYNGGSVLVFDLATGMLAFPPIDDSPAFQIAYSPDGKRIAVAHNKITPQVFDARTGQEVFALRGLNSNPASIAYNNEGTLLATGNEDGSATVWNASDGKQLFSIYDKRESFVQGITFNPDGTRIALADENSVRVYFTRLEDLIALAKTRVTRPLTQEECSKYLHVDECPKE